MACFDFYSFCLGPEGSYSLNPKIIISVDISVSLFALSFPFILHMAENRSPFPHPLKCPFHYFLLLICSILMPRALTSSLLSLQSCSIDTSSCHWILISKDYAFHVRTSILPLFKSLSLSNTFTFGSFVSSMLCSALAPVIYADQLSLSVVGASLLLAASSALQLLLIHLGGGL